MYSPAHPRGLHTTCEVTMSILEIIREFVTRAVEILKDPGRWRRRSEKKTKEDKRHETEFPKPNTVVVVERQMRMREFATPVNRVQNASQPKRVVVRPQCTDPPKYPGEEIQQQQRIMRRRIMVVSNPDPIESDSETDTAPRRKVCQYICRLFTVMWASAIPLLTPALFVPPSMSLSITNQNVQVYLHKSSNNTSKCMPRAPTAGLLREKFTQPATS